MSVSDALFAGGSDDLAVAYTSLFGADAYRFTRLAPRPRVAPMIRMVGIAATEGMCCYCRKVG